MAVSKHNLWKRKKNGLMKLVRSHSDWLERRRETKMRKLGSKRNVEVPNVDNSNQIKPGKMAKNIMSGGTKSSTKRTQVGKKV